jgi:hypothetical protein
MNLVINGPRLPALSLLCSLPLRPSFMSQLSLLPYDAFMEQVKAMVPGRSDVQCRERFCNHLIGLNKGAWSAEEVAVLSGYFCSDLKLFQDEINFIFF